MNKIIGIVGEDPNDTDAIANLLSQKFKDITFKKLLKNIRGGQLDHKRTVRALTIECEKVKPNLVLFVRDADEIHTEDNQIEKCREWYKRISQMVKKHLLLVNIYELEALIFADIEVFNKIYNTNIKGNRKVSFIVDPKGKLKAATRDKRRKFHENHCPDIFSKLRIDIVESNCDYFSEFTEQFASYLKKL